MPLETLQPVTARWMATLPADVQPTAIAGSFPGIANTLAMLWAKADALNGYVNELLFEKRGGGRGLPIRATRELHALRAYHATLHRNRDTVSERPRQW
jgi:hypothetical protein